MKYLVLGLCCVFLSLQIGVLAQDVSSVISKSQFDQMLKHRNDCSGARGFYTYEAFINAARSFQGFGTTGDINTRKREIAAFLAQTSHITSGGGWNHPDGPYAWGYCIRQQAVSNHPPSYCVSNQQWPCAPGKDYYGRGPIQIRGNDNYGPAGKDIGVDLLANPELVSKDPVISFKTAIWFWMTPQSQKPSSHDVITGRWIQSSHDKAANRMPGFGVVTNIFNGGAECGNGLNDQMQDRIGFFRRYTRILGVNPGNNLDCAKQRPFGS